MKLDPDLLRVILFDLEATPPNSEMHVPVVEGYSTDEVLEHLELLNDAGLVDVTFLGAATSRARILHAHVKRVTMAGHEFIAKARNDTLWTKTKTTMATKGLDFTIDIASRLLSGFAAQHVGLPPG